MKIAISSCLLGINCKYNGKSNYNEDIIKLKEKYEIVPICPEVLGGLPTPRIPSEIINNKVVNQEGIDVTFEYVTGANKALQILKENNIKIAILKAKSPSCGKGEIYDGTFSHTIIEGNGITTKLFIENDILVLNEYNFHQYL